jgi:hypothetical protein
MRGKLVSIKAFLSVWEAVKFCDKHPSEALFVEKELDGRYHVYADEKEE